MSARGLFLGEKVRSVAVGPVPEFIGTVVAKMTFGKNTTYNVRDSDGRDWNRNFDELWLQELG